MSEQAAAGVERDPGPAEDEFKLAAYAASIACSLIALHDDVAGYMRGRWSSEEINSTVCGHLLVGWAIILNAVAFFMVFADGGRPQYPMLGIVAAIMGLACGWMVILSEHMRVASMAFVLSSYAFLLIWAVKVAW